jgi:signal transduction histidine kinase
VNRMLSDLRAFASPEPDVDPRAMESFDDIVSQAVSFARFDRDCANRHIVTHLRSETTLFVDKLALYQVFLNLLRNAVEATRPGGRVEVRSFREGDFVCAEFTDNGAGVPVELRGRLFDAFATGRHEQGIGLGLQSSKRIVELHGGSIVYFPAAAGGSEFLVRLPINATPQGTE